METTRENLGSHPPRQQRGLARRVRTPAAAAGFAGKGHTAVEVLTPSALEQSDPFVLLMDDRLDFGNGRQIGGAHPHAGLETVTLVLEGAVEDRDEGLLRAGDALWMTAGSGIIHNEHVNATGHVRVLQLWVTLPKRQRDAAPRFELIRLDSLPIRREAGVTARLYSGSTGTLRSPTQNHVPVTLVDFELEARAVIEQELPATYNGFLYVIDGAIAVGDDATPLSHSEVGWLDSPASTGSTSLRLRATGSSSARVVLYAGERQGEPVVQHGPFVAGSLDDIARLFREYQAGRFVRMSSLAHAAQRAQVSP